MAKRAASRSGRDPGQARNDNDGDVWCDTVVCITLEERGSRTVLSLEQTTFATVAHCEERAFGWNQCLDRLVQFAEARNN